MGVCRRRPADELVGTHSLDRSCDADGTQSPAPWSWIYEAIGAPKSHNQGQFNPFCPPLSFRSSTSFVCVVIWPGRSFVLHFLLFYVVWFTSYFSCVNGFVLSDMCEKARLWLLFLQLCPPPTPTPTPLSSKHPYTVKKKSFSLLISYSLFSVFLKFYVFIF